MTTLRGIAQLSDCLLTHMLLAYWRKLLEQYRHAQSKILGKTPRSLNRRTLSVLEFVNQHRGESWRKLFRAWNEAHPRQRFKDRSHLYTTYTRAVERVVGVKPVKG